MEHLHTEYAIISTQRVLTSLQSPVVTHSTHIHTHTVPPKSIRKQMTLRISAAGIYYSQLSP